MAGKSHTVELTKSMQLIDLNDSQNRCVVTFQIEPSDITVPYDIAVVSQGMLDSEDWEATSASIFKRFSGPVSNSVEIDDDQPQSYFLGLRAAPGHAEPLALHLTLTVQPSQQEAYAAPPQQPMQMAPTVMDAAVDELTIPWYQTSWGVLLILLLIAVAAYFGYNYFSKKRTRFSASNRVQLIPSEPRPTPVAPPSLFPRPSFADTKAEEPRHSEYRTKPKISTKKAAPVTDTPAPAPAPVEPASPARSDASSADGAPEAAERTNLLSSRLLAKIKAQQQQ